MATRYWISNTNSNANVATNWNTLPDATGSIGIPATGDIVVFGHPDSFAVQLGNGACTWDLSLVLANMTLSKNYSKVTTTSESISFTAPSTITHEDIEWESLGYRAGMKIINSGATNAANNGTFTISAITDTVITLVETTLATESAGASVTVTYDTFLDVQQDFELNLLTTYGNIRNTSGVARTITFTGVHDATANQRYILNGENSSITNGDDITYEINGSANGPTATFLDDGFYPKVSIDSTTVFTCGYKEPTYGGFQTASMYGFNVVSTASTAVDTTATPQDSQKKHFIVENATLFTYNPSVFDAGKSTWEFITDGSTSQFPVSDDTKTYRWYNVIVTAGVAGQKLTIPSNRTLSINSLTVNVDAVLEGHKTRGDVTSTIVSVRRPKILGAWNFSQLSDGVYVSLMETAFPVTPSIGSEGYVQLSNGSGAFNSDSKLSWDDSSSELTVDGKLTVTGLIDPTGMVFTPQATNPESTNPQDTIWIDSETNHLYRGERNVESTVHFNVRNDEGTTIPVGAPLYSRGEIGGSNRIKVGIADASDPNKMPAIGLAMEEMNTTSTQDGNMILTGILNENITITGIVEQDIIYVAPHGGSAPYLTITRPTSPSHLVQNVGVCIRQAAANVSQGMKVAAIGRTNDSPNCSFLMVNTESTHPQARRLVAGTNITLTDGGAGGDLTIAASGGGSGTVTSVAVTGSDGLQVDSGSPITTSGTIALGVDAAALRTHINVENGADVTDTANVTAAGALMDSEVTNLADVKSFDPADYAPATQETCMVRLATSITSFTPTSAYTLLQSNIPNPLWDASPPNLNFDANTGLYTVPSAGVYHISWNVAFRFTSSGQTQASRIYVNGNPAAQGNVNTTGNWPIGGGSILLTLAANDTVGLYVYISATGKNLVGDTTSVGAVHMSINKVSE